MPASSIELTISGDPQLFDDLVGVMSVMGFDGFWEDGPTLRCYISPHCWNPELLASLRDSARSLASSRGKQPPLIAQSTVPPRDWNEEWERSLTPIRVTDRIVVTPSRALSPDMQNDNAEVVITIDPKMSFGTGYHESTRIALRLLQNHLIPDSLVLDVGTGTGILAIAAVKLGAREAVGVDTDEWAAVNARENVGQNGVDQKVRIVLGEISAVERREFQMVTVNIQRRVIELLLPELLDRIGLGGQIILSGLLRSDRRAIMATCAKLRLAITDEESENGWIGLVARAVGFPPVGGAGGRRGG
jgi:ribosomal protein L11 methyltransferase